MDEPVKSHADHLVDAMRYAVHGLVDRFGFATARPRETIAPVWFFELIVPRMQYQDVCRSMRMFHCSLLLVICLLQ